MAIPFVVGQWVRGPRFYGRRSLIDTLLAAGSGITWVVGTRRIGKTSLAREIERLTADGGRGLLPLYWDLEGATSAGELHASFADALADAGERLVALGLSSDELVRVELASAISRLVGGAKQLQTLGHLAQSNRALATSIKGVAQTCESHRSQLVVKLRSEALTNQ